MLPKNIQMKFSLYRLFFKVHISTAFPVQYDSYRPYKVYYYEEIIFFYLML